MARVLVADDHPPIVRLLEHVFQTERHEVITAADGKEALRKAREDGPDLVVLDVVMPGMTGLEVLQALKGDPATAAILVIMLTGHDEAADLHHGLQLGADWYVPKPFSPQEMIALARRFLGPAP